MTPDQIMAEAMKSALQLERCAHARTRVELTVARYDQGGPSLTRARWIEKLESATSRGWLTQEQRTAILRGDFELFAPAEPPKGVPF